MTKTFENLDGIIRFLENAPQGMYVMDQADDAGWQSAGEALDSYKEIRDHANADEIAAFEGTELAIKDTAATERKIEEEGCAELDGYWIYTAAAIADEQKTWDDDDPGRNVDVSEYPYWVLCEGENPGPYGYDSLQDIVEAFLNR